jgi:hypothetical protein
VDGVVTFANIGDAIGNKVLSDDNQTFYVNSSPVTLNSASLLSASSDNTTLYFDGLDNGTSGVDGSYTRTSTDLTEAVDNGSNVLYVWAKDAAGQGPTLIDNLSIFHDDDRPTIGTITLYEGGSENSTHTDNASLTIVFDNVTDGGGVGIWKYYASVGGSYSDNLSDWEDYPASENGTITLTGDLSADEGQTKTVSAWVMDNLTNVSDVMTDSIYVNSEKPVISTAAVVANVTVNSTSADSISENVTVTISATDNFIVDSYYITANNTTNTYQRPWIDPNGWVDFSSPSKSVTENATLPLSGLSLTDNMSIYVWVRDNKTNDGPNYTDNYTVVYATLIDNASPIITANSVVISDNGSGSTDNATGDNVTLSISATDTFGVVSYYITDNASDNLSTEFDNFTSQGTSVSQNVLYSFSSQPDNGTLTLYVYVKDAAGNVSDNASDNIIYYQ